MPEQLEERVAHLEAEFKQLKHRVERGFFSSPWWEKVAGTFADKSAYDEAMRLGREYRDSLRQSPTEPSDE
ncbi:hypothetical protein [Pseudanabaena sp. PCC 6802]|uniref:hypothetical protein n=1 Tax=Pseudanabaena sp. PCC 6802 TaxID=118173 RepID=UPI00034BE370|nr:hypothetical protein [Pseudanabaena sp. PCC 6802]